MKIIVGISGATGIIYGVHLLEALRELSIETHLVMSHWAIENLTLETDYSLDQVVQLADHFYENNQMGAAIASGSFKTDGMVIIPCSMKSLAAIAVGYAENLLHRAADVTLKEGRKLILAPRETPLNVIHLENMLKLARSGVVIMPPMPSFYHKPESISDLVKHHTGRILDRLNLDNQLVKRWTGETSQYKIV
jgi:4-hydroxy-3-polyprenylbenzoate decarboxylase